MYGSTSRFTLLLLEEGEDYVADFNAYIFAPGILSDIAKGPITIDETSYKPPGTNKGIHGKLRLCTKSVFFDAEDVSVPILRYASPESSNNCQHVPNAHLLWLLSFHSMSQFFINNFISCCGCMCLCLSSIPGYPSSAFTHAQVAHRTSPCRLPFTHVVSCNAMGPKELHIKAKFYTTCKAGNLDRPYVHKQLSKEASVVIQLEFASMDSLIVQLMQVLEISKTSNFIEKGMMLGVRFNLRPHAGTCSSSQYSPIMLCTICNVACASDVVVHGTVVLCK